VRIADLAVSLTLMDVQQALKSFLWIFFLMIGCEMKAQPISLLRYRSDTTSVVKRALGDLVSRPFVPKHDTLLKHISVLMAYEAFSKSTAIDYTTPIDKKVDFYTHKAQSEWMLAIYKAALVEHYAKNESGVLPLLDKTIAHFDSSTYYYGKVNQYMVGQAKLINRVDSAFAQIIGDDLKGYIEKMQAAQNMDIIRGFTIKDRAEELFDTVRKEFPEEFVHQSLTYWIMMGFKDENPSEMLKN
jgi:hypothetical protein